MVTSKNELIQEFLDKYNSLPAKIKEEYLQEIEKIIKRIKLEKTINDPTKLTFRFGKFKGKQITEVPAWYLLWCYGEDWFKKNNKEMYAFVKANLKTLKKQKEDDDLENKKESIIAEVEHDDYGDRDPE